MSAKLATAAEDHDIEQRLDQLIPAPASSGKKLVWGSAVVALALAVSVMNLAGLILPRPTAGGSYSSGYPLVVDRAEQVISTQVMMPNYSQRPVRITDVELDAPGATLVSVQVIVEPEAEGEVQEDGSVVTQESADAAFREELLDLPVTVAPGERAFFVVSFRPDDCVNPVDPAGSWGFVKPTLDFGDGAILPFGRTITLNQDPIFDNTEDLQFQTPDRRIINIEADGTMIQTGILSGACEYLR